MKTAAAFLLLIALAFAPVQAQDRDQGVFEYAVRSANGTVPTVTDAVSAAATTAGYQVVGRIASGVPDGCGYTAQVLVLWNPSQAAALMAANAQTGPFMAVDRVTVFSDEEGVHVAFVNPLGISRTILVADEEFSDLARARHAKLRTMLTGAVTGTVSDRQYGPERDKGHIGKTMGVMAGGSFDGKVQVHGTVADATVADVVAQLRDALATPGPEWGLKRVYEIAIPGSDAVVFGVTGARMEGKSFDIVKAGGDKDRKDLSCAGLAHAASYPLELVVRANGGNVDIQFVDAMFRMKMYFEDAGKWAFMKNMGMPGSLAGELESLYKTKLGL